MSALRFVNSSVFVTALVYLLSFTLVCATNPTPASADAKTPGEWYSSLDREGRATLDRGLGFVRKFREPGQCKETVDELAGAMTSLSPEVLGAVVGLALGAAAGAASTASILGALRGGILLGSVGSALGHLADVLLPDGVSALADNVQDMIQERDGKLCELIKASDKLRSPVIEHLQTALERECQDQGPGALQRCLRDDPEAAGIFERHAAVLETINQGTCRVAASVVKRFDRGPAGRAGATLVARCEEDEEKASEAPVLGKNVL